MKALTLKQPWATLVAIGAKKIETRSWGTKYRGPLAIHASAKWDHDGMVTFYLKPVREALERAGYGMYPERLPVGAIIATCDLIGVDQFGNFVNQRNPMIWGKGKYIFELTFEERTFGDFSVGRYGWFLANVNHLLAPIPAKGSLGLWECKSLQSLTSGI